MIERQNVEKKIDDILTTLSRKDDGYGKLSFEPEFMDELEQSFIDQKIHPGIIHLFIQLYGDVKNEKFEKAVILRNKIYEIVSNDDSFEDYNKSMKQFVK